LPVLLSIYLFNVTEYNEKPRSPDVFATERLASATTGGRHPVRGEYGGSIGIAIRSAIET
jgi:hypothetical protein